MICIRCERVIKINEPYIDTTLSNSKVIAWHARVWKVVGRNTQTKDCKSADYFKVCGRWKMV